MWVKGIIACVCVCVCGFQRTCHLWLCIKPPHPMSCYPPRRAPSLHPVCVCHYHPSLILLNPPCVCVSPVYKTPNTQINNGKNTHCGTNPSPKPEHNIVERSDRNIFSRTDMSFTDIQSKGIILAIFIHTISICNAECQYPGLPLHHTTQGDQ